MRDLALANNNTGSTNQVDHLKLNKGNNTSDFEKLSVLLEDHLNLRADSDEKDESNFSYTAVETLMRRVQEEDSDIFSHRLSIPADFIFSQTEIRAIIQKCQKKLGKEIEEVPPSYHQYDPHAPSLDALVRSTEEKTDPVTVPKPVNNDYNRPSPSFVQNTEKKTDDVPPPKKGLNLGYNPVLESLNTIVRSTEMKTREMFEMNKTNDGFLEMSSKLSDLANKLRIDEKEEKGVDYEKDEVAKKMLIEAHQKFPTLFGNSKTDQNGQLMQFKFSHTEVEALKISLSEKATMVLARQKPNESAMLNAMQENNLLNEIALQAEKNHENHMRNILNNLAKAKSAG